ncbi:solute carrier family 24 [Pelomyxa schiedti]|nr:solute carrier family 24 [Pelomyxa schiedti]
MPLDTLTTSNGLTAKCLQWAPDVFADIASMRHGQWQLAMGVSLGAGLFVTTVVVGVLSIISNVKVKAYPFLRDTLFYIGALVVLFILFWDGKIYLWEAIALLLYYLIYVGLATTIHIILHRTRNHSIETDAGDMFSIPSVDSTTKPVSPAHSYTQGSSNQVESLEALNLRNPSGADSDQNKPPAPIRSPEFLSKVEINYTPRVTVSPNIGLRLERCPSIHIDEIPIPEELPRPRLNRSCEDYRVTDPRNNFVNPSSTHQVQVIPQLVPTVRRNDFRYSFMKRSKMMEQTGVLSLLQAWKREIRKGEQPLQVNCAEDDTITPGEVNCTLEKKDCTVNRTRRCTCRCIATYKWLVGWEDMSLCEKILHCLMLPFNCLLLLTTPTVSSPVTSPRLLAVQISFSSVPILVGTKYISYWICNSVPLFVVVFPCTLILGIVVFLTTRRRSILPTPYRIVLVMYSFAVSIIWIYAIADEAVWLLKCIGLEVHISEAILGLTVLSWGNSLGGTLICIGLDRS